MLVTLSGWPAAGDYFVLSILTSVCGYPAPELYNFIWGGSDGSFPLNLWRKRTAPDFYWKQVRVTSFAVYYAVILDVAS